MTLHKSDAGGVRLGLRTSAEVHGAYRVMKDTIGQEMTGAIVQPMAPDGVEIIVGAVRHPSFGPLVMVGMGGVSAELLTDRAFRGPPLTRQDATEMIRELRCAPLLFGYRGRPAVVNRTFGPVSATSPRHSVPSEEIPPKVGYRSQASHPTRPPYAGRFESTKMA